VQVGQVHIRVGLGDRRVVPVGDVTVEDCSDGVGVHVDVFGVHPRQVVNNSDRADVQRQLDEFTAEAPVSGRVDLLLGVHRVRAGEDDRPVEELLASGARTDRVVVHVHTGGFGEAGLPAHHRVLLRTGAGAGDAAGQ